MNNKEDKKIQNGDMTTGSPGRLIILFALPVLLGTFFQQIYTAADTAVVSRTLGASALAAVGCMNSVNLLILGFTNGVGMGFSIPVAQAFGAGDYKKLKSYVGNMIWLYLIFAAVTTIISALLCRTILVVTNTPDDIFSMAYTYMLVMFLGIPAQFAYNTLAGVIRSMGDSKNPLYILILSSLLNIALDFLFILAFGWGVFGAAFATVLCQAISAVGCLFIIMKKYPVLCISGRDLKIQKDIFADLLKNALPMGFMVSICGIGSLILQASVNTLGSVSIAAITASERIGQILQSVSTALGSAISVYAGQNAGAKRFDRVKQGVRFGAIASIIYVIIMFLVVLFFGKPIIGIFIDGSQTELLDLAYRYLLILSMFFWGQSFIFVFRFALQGMGYPQTAVVSSTLEMLARGAIGLYFIPAFGFNGACFSNPLAWVSANAFILPAYFIIIRRKLAEQKQK